MTTSVNNPAPASGKGTGERANLRFLLKHPAHLIAFGFGTGLAPKAPGTVGTLLGLPLFWATTAITHGCPLDAEAIGQLHKLRRIVVTGPAAVDAAACKVRGIAVHHLGSGGAAGHALITLLESLTAEAGG